MPCLAEDLCCDSEDSDSEHLPDVPPKMGTLYARQPAWFLPASQEVDETVTESMFSYYEDVESADNLLQYSVSEPIVENKHKPKRDVKAERK